MKLLFNRNPISLGRRIEQPPQELIKNTLSLWNCSVEDALKYGGDLTREAIGAINIRNDRKYVVVDTKIHMLMPGFYPAIPGWHSDGVPRGPEGNPASKGLPNIHLQENSELRPPRYHLLVTGKGCLTEFIKEPVMLDVPEEPTSELYKKMTKDINLLLNDKKISIIKSPTSTVVEWDWWNIHRSSVAKLHEWRFLIRVTETDYFASQTDLRKIIRTQQQVYTPPEFGW